MTTLNPGDLLIEKNGSYAILLNRVSHWGVGSWTVMWDNGKKDTFPWVENSIIGDIYEGNIKHIKGGHEQAMKKIARFFEWDFFDIGVMSLVMLVIYSLVSCVQQ